jgi:sulfide:quinone oxidoreductase
MVLRVVIAGAGVAGLECALALRALAGEKLAIELLAPKHEPVERPVSVKTPFGGADAPRVDVERLAAGAGLRLHRYALAAVDPDAREVLTSEGRRVGYDLLVVATGARSREAVPGAVTFRGPMSAGLVERVLSDPGRRIAVAVPDGPVWPLPAYELVLLSSAALGDSGDLVLVTAEPEPLGVFGRAAVDAMRTLLAERGIELRTGTAPEAAIDGALALRDGSLVTADAVVALPALVGPRIPGLPHDDGGFLPVDEHGVVAGCPNVLAAGDATASEVKHGGLAAQQADAVAETIAARVGALAEPAPVRPVLRGLLMTGAAPLYLRADLSAVPVRGEASAEPLWSPPAKVAARYLARFLGQSPGATITGR